jgi:hypothetical protein
LDLLVGGHIQLIHRNAEQVVHSFPQTFVISDFLDQVGEAFCAEASQIWIGLKNGVLDEADAKFIEFFEANFEHVLQTCSEYPENCLHHLNFYNIQFFGQSRQYDVQCFLIQLIATISVKLHQQLTHYRLEVNIVNFFQQNLANLSLVDQDQWQGLANIHKVQVQDVELLGALGQLQCLQFIEEE